jgi:hypothetical protein
MGGRCLSDQWDVQATIKRINESLIARGYVTWFDLTNMKGIYGSPTSTLLATPVVFLRSIGADRLYTRTGDDAGSTVDA